MVATSYSMEYNFNKIIMSYKSKKIFTIILTFSLLFFSFSPILAKHATAQWVVWDPGNFVPNNITAISTSIVAGNTTAGSLKEFGLDTVAWVIVNLIIERMAASTVNWINGGFRGSPAFITDPEAYYKNIGDQIAGQFIFSNPDLNFLCSPLQAKIKLALTSTYNRNSDRFQCRLSQVGKNLDNFVDDFSNGGWDSFFIVSQTAGENPLGAYLQAEGQLYEKIANKQDIKKQELLQGNGFLSFKQCDQWENVVNQGQTQLGDTTGGTFDENGIPQDTRPDDPEDTEAPPGTKRRCTKESVTTPGNVISSQLNKTLGLGNDKLVVADEINEIVSALLNQLVSQVVGGVGRGLRGISRPSSTGGQTFAGQLTNRKPGDKIEGYFCLDQDTDPNSPYYDTDPNSCGNPDTPDTGILDYPPETPPDCVNNPDALECKPAACINDPNAIECQDSVPTPPITTPDPINTPDPTSTP